MPSMPNLYGWIEHKHSNNFFFVKDFIKSGIVQSSGRKGLAADANYVMKHCVLEHATKSL